METVTFFFVAVIATLGSIVLGNDIAMFAAARTGLAFWPLFVGLLALVAAGAGIAYRFDQLFWYGGIIALFGACYSLGALGLMR